MTQRAPWTQPRNALARGTRPATRRRLAPRTLLHRSSALLRTRLRVRQFDTTKGYGGADDPEADVLSHQGARGAHAAGAAHRRRAVRGCAHPDGPVAGDEGAHAVSAPAAGFGGGRRAAGPELRHPHVRGASHGPLAAGRDAGGQGARAGLLLSCVCRGFARIAADADAHAWNARRWRRFCST